MERGQMSGGEQYARLHEAGDLRVSPEDPDPTGWAVVDRSGQRIGTVDELIVDTAAMKVRYLEIELDDAPTREEHLLVDIDEIDLLDKQHQAVLKTMSRQDLRIGEQRGRAGSRGPFAQAHDRGQSSTRLTRAEEELHIGRREEPAGEVVINRSVDTEHVTRPVERKVERVRVERRPVSGEPRSEEIGERQLRVPIMEEDVVVEKRPVVKEELVVSKDVETETENVEADLRKERLDVQGEGGVTEDGSDARRRRSDSPDRGGRRG